MARVGDKQDYAGLMMCGKRKHVEICLSPKREEFITQKISLPDDVIAEILSWMTVKCILRFKCVCKSWESITEDQSFIKKHMSRSKYQPVYEKHVNDERFHFESYSDGLVVEKCKKTSKYRIRNPATKQVVEVLDDPEDQGRWRDMVMGFDSSFNNCKLLCIYKKGTTEYCFKMLTVGTDLAWRPLNISFSCDDNERLIKYTFSEEFIYIISLCKAELEKTEIIICNYKLEEESFMKIKIPQGFQTGGDQFQGFVWGEKLSLGFIIKNELHVWVLENIDKQIWSDKKTIPLNFMDNYFYRNKKLRVSWGFNGKLKIYVDNNDWLRYDIESKEEYFVKVPPGKKIIYDMAPCLLSVKGMKSEHTI